MDASNQMHYLPGKTIDRDTPLDRYLPPIQRDVVSTWLFKNVPPGSWLIDPFGSSPELIYEAASSGYKVLVSINNPIIRFILELRCLSLQESDFKAAIALLASSQVGGERLELHIKSLYQTICEGCGRSIQAEAFIWKRGAMSPSGRIYSCPYCGDSGERPITQLDIDKGSRFEKHGLHRARALERVTPLHDPDRHHVEEAIEVYLPRAIYALITMINKLAGIPKNDRNYRLLCALLLLAFDRGNTLWSYPKARQRPKQLTIPPQFLEHNIWLALETAAKIWTHNSKTIPIVRWPQEPPLEGGISIFEGRIKTLATSLSRINNPAVVTSFPRPNQAFWTLSALWSGWLWGYEALDQFKSVLRRRRYDWSWHINAIQSALNYLVPSLPEDTPYFGLINEVEPGFLSAVLLGCQLSKLKLSGIALRAEDAQAQLTWQVEKIDSINEEGGVGIEGEIISSTKAYLLDRGEPCSYPYLHTAGLVGLVSHPRNYSERTPGDTLSQVHATFQECLNQNHGYLRYSGSDKSLDVGLWWLSDTEGEISPLSDRVETAFLNHLQKHPGQTLHEIDAAICNTTPGLSPPDSDFIYECLQSYCSKEIPQSNNWVLRSSEDPDRRRADLIEISQCLLKLGERLGFNVSENKNDIDSIRWSSNSKPDEFIFFLATSALLGNYLIYSFLNNQRPFLVIPGSRSNLVAYKLEKNPYLNHFFEHKWSFIKYRLVRQLLDNNQITLDNLEEHLALDPITYTTPQIRMF